MLYFLLSCVGLSNRGSCFELLKAVSIKGLWECAEKSLTHRLVEAFESLKFELFELSTFDCISITNLRLQFLGYRSFLRIKFG